MQKHRKVVLTVLEATVLVANVECAVPKPKNRNHQSRGLSKPRFW